MEEVMLKTENVNIITIDVDNYDACAGNRGLLIDQLNSDGSNIPVVVSMQYSKEQYWGDTKITLAKKDEIPQYYLVEIQCEKLSSHDIVTEAFRLGMTNAMEYFKAEKITIDNIYLMNIQKSISCMNNAILITEIVLKTFKLDKKVTVYAEIPDMSTSKSCLSLSMDSDKKDKKNKKKKKGKNK